MEREPKLKTKLEFRFNSDELDMPLMNFLSEDPVEKFPNEIRIHQKIKNIKKKQSQNLF